MTRQSLLKSLEVALNGRRDGAQDARLLLCRALNITREELFAHPETRVSFFQSIRARSFATRRQKNEPIAYILQYREFLGREFLVNRNVLIPRPETEVIVNLVQNEKPFDLVLDIGTGSGALAITLALETNARIIATDISRRALRVAKKNAKTLGAGVIFRRCSLLRIRKVTFRAYCVLSSSLTSHISQTKRSRLLRTK